jgi:hypothetical protein
MPFRALAVVALALCPLSVGAADLENPYKRAKLGDYATYAAVAQSPLGESKTNRSVIITAVGERQVSVKIVIERDGKGTPPTQVEQKIDITKPFNPGTAEDVNFVWERLKEGKGKLTVGNKEYECTWITYKPVVPRDSSLKPEGERTIWISKDLPFIVKDTLKMRVGTDDISESMQLIGIGHKMTPPVPPTTPLHRSLGLR